MTGTSIVNGEPVSPAPGACPRCGGRTTAAVAGGACAACLLALALDSADVEEEEDGQSALSSPVYQVLALVGGDASRTVYLAEEPQTRRLVTLDVIRAAAVGLTPAEFESRLARLTRLDHAAIPRVFGGRVTADGDYCVIAEYVAGQAVGRQAGAAHAGGHGLIQALCDACDALAHAHQRGLVHGRLDASALLLVRRGDRLWPMITGLSVCPRTVSEADDVAALLQVVRTVLGGTLAECLPPPSEVRTMADLRASLAVLLQRG